MYNSQIGQFNIESMVLDPPPYIRLWTDAPVNSPVALEWLEELRNGPRGVAEITDISVGEHYVILELSDVVSDSEEAREVVRCFMQRVATAATEFTEWDIARFRSLAVFDPRRAEVVYAPTSMTIDH